METAGKILVVVCALLLAISASLAQPADPDRFDPDLEYTMPEASPPRSAGKFARDNGLGHLLLKNLRFRDVQRTPTWLMKLNARVPERADDSAHAGFIERKAPSKRDKVTLDDLMGFLRSFDTRETTSDDGVKLPSLRFGRK